MANLAVSTEDAPAAIGPYSQAVASDNTVFVSGQLPITKSGDMPISIEAQTAQVFENIQSILQAHAMELSDVVKTTVFLADMNDFPSMNATYETFFPAGVKPARSAFQVVRLPKGAKLEIEVIARK